jgi:hypothetical protein
VEIVQRMRNPGAFLLRPPDRVKQYTIPRVNISRKTWSIVLVALIWSLAIYAYFYRPSTSSSLYPPPTPSSVRIYIGVVTIHTSHPFLWFPGSDNGEDNCIFEVRGPVHPTRSLHAFSNSRKRRCNSPVCRRTTSRGRAWDDGLVEMGTRTIWGHANS